MVHHHGLTPLEFLQGGVFLLKLLLGLLVDRAFFLKKTAQPFNFYFGTVGGGRLSKTFKI
jgi:hypothetical protein